MKPATRAKWVLMLAVSINQMNPLKISAAEQTADEGPSLELLEFIGSMVESSEGELLGPESLDESEPSEQVVKDTWISRDSPYTRSVDVEAQSRSWSEDNVLEKESEDE